MSDDEFEDLPDPFIGISETEWTRILDPEGQRDAAQSRPDSRTNSDFGDDAFTDMDAGVLAEIDRIEAHALQTQTLNVPTSPSEQRTVVRPASTSTGHLDHTENQHSPYYPASGQMALQQDLGSSPPPAKRPRTQSLTVSSKQKGKQRDNNDTHQLYKLYEEEMTCPVCCDLFVATHVGNPCGHSYCGDCAWEWIKKSKQNQCPVCRARLIKREPLIPNIAMDNLVECHLHHLQSIGVEEWQPLGSNFKERAVRLQEWKNTAKARLKSKQKPQRPVRPVLIGELWETLERGTLFLPDDDDDEYVEGSSEGHFQSNQPNRPDGVQRGTNRQTRNRRGRR